MVSTAVKRTVLGTAAALMLSVGTLNIVPALPAQAAEPSVQHQDYLVERKVKIFRDSDGSILAICYYTDSGQWIGCDLMR
jgi:hypothetical protein